MKPAVLRKRNMAEDQADHEMIDGFSAWLREITMEKEEESVLSLSQIEEEKQ